MFVFGITETHMPILSKLRTDIKNLVERFLITSCGSSCHAQFPRDSQNSDGGALKSEIFFKK